MTSGTGMAKQRYTLVLGLSPDGERHDGMRAAHSMSRTYVKNIVQYVKNIVATLISGRSKTEERKNYRLD